MKYMHEIKKHLSILFIFLKYSLQTEMQYRFNFFMGIILDVLFFFTKIIYALIVYKTDVIINGLNPDAILLFIGTYTIVQGLFTLLFLVNFNYTLPDSVREGTLDIYMTKPISLQFVVSTMHIEISTMVPDLIGGIILVIIACDRLDLDLTLHQILIYLFLIMVGLIIAYAFFFLIQLLSFFFINVRAISDVSGEIFSLNNLPMTVYNKIIRFVGIYILPIFLITNYAPMYLLRQLTIWQFLWFVFIAILLLILSRCAWTSVIKKYTSASS